MQEEGSVKLLIGSVIVSVDSFPNSKLVCNKDWFN